MNLPKTDLIILFSALALFYTPSCKNANTIPFPENETDFPQPVSKPFKFSEPQKIKWETPKPDIIKPTTQTNIDINKLPSKPFDISGFQPFKNPMTGTKIDWDHLPGTTFNLKNLPTEKLRFKISILGKPSIIKTGIPHIKDNAKTNLLILDAGLPNLHVDAMLLDSKGILWLGTGQGLCRFDGEYCSIYGRDQGLGTFLIYELCEDRDGKIWIGTRGGGVEIIDPKAGIIKKITINEGLGNDEIFGLLSDRLGQMWIGSWGGGIDIINEREETLKHFKNIDQLSANYVRSFLEESNGDIWVGTGSGAYIINEHEGKIKHLDKALGLSNNEIESLFENKAGEIWVGTRDQLNIVYEKSGIIKHLGIAQGLSGSWIRCVIKDVLGRIWVGSLEGGVDIINGSDGTIKHLSKNEGLGNKNIHCFIETGHDHIWIGTEGGGVNIFDETEAIAYLNAGQDFKTKSFSGLLEDSKGQIWVGTDRGAYIIDQKLKAIKYLKIDVGADYFIEDSRGQIWIGTNKGLYVLDPNTRIMKHIDAAQGLTGNNVTSLFEDTHNQIWIGIYSDGIRKEGINIIDEGAQTLKHLNTGQDFSQQYVVGFLEDRQGQIWTSIYGRGIDVIDQKSRTFRQITDAQILRNNNVGTLLEDSLHRIWIGTEGSGVDMIDSKASTLTNFSVTEGLINNSVISLKIKDDKVFALTGNGLTIITAPSDNSKGINQWQQSSYEREQSLLNYALTEYFSLLTKKGEFWWGIGNRIIIMGTPKKDTTLPHTYLTSIDIMNQPLYFADEGRLQNQLQKTDTLWDFQNDSFYLKGQLPAYLNYLKKNNILWDSVTAPYNIPVNLQLPYYENYLTFHFIGSGSENLNKTTYYRYFLDGIDKRWSNISTNPVSENYLNLSPGNYMFMVRSKSSNGSWSKPAEFRFIILPAFWQTWWFYLIETITLIAFIYWIIKFYTGRKLAKQKIDIEKIKAVSTERERIASDMHDDLGAGLTAIRLLSEVANLKTVKDSAAKSEIERIVVSAHNLSDNLREIIWTMNTKYDKLEDFIIYVRGYAVEFFDNTSIKFQFNNPTNMPQKTMPGEVRRNIFLCIKEALNNIVRHSMATETSLTFYFVDDFLYAEIKDNGVGIDTNQINKFGNGLNSMKERLNKYGSNLEIEVTNGTNLKFKIKL